MAMYDHEAGVHVVRIVYDGAALAGKTTSLRKLAEIFRRPLFSGEEAEGRTLFFDWLDILGGRFEGSPIRCQIVSVPGQTALVGRRKTLLETADAVVLVVDSTQGGLAGTQRAIDVLRETIEHKTPPVGIIVQANKRDHAEALPRSEIEAMVATLGTTALTETVATHAKGVRETLVLAVRLALDRVQELIRQGTLEKGRPEIDSGADLLAALRHFEAVSEDGTAAAPERIAASAQEPSPVPVEEIPTAHGSPNLPRPDVAPGSIWPPVEGRMLLHDAARQTAKPERTKRGDWILRHTRWCWHSSLEHSFDHHDSARDVLIAWAQWHTRMRNLMSDDRLIVLAEATRGAWRLWQIVGRVPTIKEGLAGALASADPQLIAERLRTAAQALIFAENELLATGLLDHVDLGSLALHHDRIVYTGLAPPPGAPRSQGRDPVAPSKLLREQLGPWIENAGIEQRGDTARIVDGVLKRIALIGREPYLETVAAMLIGH